MRKKTNETIRVLASVALAIAMAACSLTQPAKPRLPDNRCALIPPEICSQLTPGRAGGAALRYIAPDVPWGTYTKVMLSPVTVWGGETGKVPLGDVQVMVDYLYNVFVTAFATKFQIVDLPGPGVLQIVPALTDADAATPVLRTVSMAVPQARVLATLQYVATGTYPSIGSAQGEIVARDSVSGRILGAGVDRRVGGGSIATAAQWKWGDVKNALDAWAQSSVDRLVSLQSSGR